jgi:AAA+ ATPase superfamily predicted ATPase
MTRPTLSPTSTSSGDEFVGRRAELAVLATAYRTHGGAFVPVYGRRRIGKSELILHFLRDRPGIYHVGKQAPAGLQLREFLDEAARALDEPLLAALPAGDWKSALETVEQRYTGKGKLVLAFDEFQWTAGASPELPSVLQELWDRRWRRSGKVMLVVCGSFVGFMEREVLGEKSPLYGRRTAQIHLQPFGFREAAEFHPCWSVVERARAYFVCGGVPLYLRAFAPERSVEASIAACLLSEYAPLFREPEFLLREELRGVENYHAVLLAIAAGHGTTPAIARTSGLPERSLPYYLEQLVQLGYVARRHPLTGARRIGRHVRFSLEDPLLRFWFRFVFPHRSAVVQLGSARALRELVKPELDAYFGGCFERLCREALPELCRREGVDASLEVGEYWDPRTQIDVVGVRDDGWTELGECKWGTVKSVPALVTELDEKVRAFPNARGASLARRLFVRHLPAGAARATGVKWHTLDQLYDRDA